MVEVSSKTAVWYSTGSFAVPVRWVLVHDPEENSKPGPSCVPTSRSIRRRSSVGL